MLVVPAVAVAPYPLGGGPGRVLLGRVVALANRADPRVFPRDVVNTGRHGRTAGIHPVFSRTTAPSMPGFIILMRRSVRDVVGR